MSNDVFIIAEAGVNHNGSLDLAMQLVDVAAKSGANAVKFQTFCSEKVVTANAGLAAYQEANTGEGGSQLEMIRALELSEDSFRELAAHAHSSGIEFMSTAFDANSLRFLVDDLGVRRIKIPSGDITNAPYLLEAASHGLPMIVSTGMCTLGDIQAALGVITFGYSATNENPSARAFDEAYGSRAGRAALARNVTLLHCTTEYPAPFADVCLRAMNGMRDHFDLPVGYSDHTEGIAVAIAAVALGAPVVEKHFTLDRGLPGPDHRASLEPNELMEMVRAIRQTSEALGSADKQPSPSEIPNINVARRSLVAARKIKKGEIFESSMIDAKRPGSGMSPMALFGLVGRHASRNYEPDDLLDE